MALEITKQNDITKWEIPLMKGDLAPDDINDWEDNSWIIEHLRALADKIEREDPKIINMGIEINPQYKTPQLYIEFYEKIGL